VSRSKISQKTLHLEGGPIDEKKTNGDDGDPGGSAERRWGSNGKMSTKTGKIKDTKGPMVIRTVGGHTLAAFGGGPKA